jgi:ABC-type amino acid transport substrate-binding protein
LIESSALNRNFTILTIADGSFVKYDAEAPDDQRWSGYSIDVLKKIKQVMVAEGKPFDYTLKRAEKEDGSQESFNGLVTAVVEDHKADMYWAATFITESRVQDATFTLPYAHDSLVMVRPKYTQPNAKLLPFKTLNDVRSYNRKACVLGDSANEVFLRRNYGTVELITGSSFTELINHVRNGTCAVAVDSRLSVMIAFGTPDYCDMEVVGLDFWDVPVASAVRKSLNNSFAIAEELSLVIGELEDQDYFYEEIEKPYINAQLDACTDSNFKHHYTFVTVIDPPFVQYDSAMEGNARFTGYIMSSIAKAAERGGFTYTLKLPDTDPSCAPYCNRSYAHGVEEVIDNSTATDCYWAGYFITSERLSISSLTTPFVDTGLVLVVKRPKGSNSSNLLFKPFTGSLWLTILLLGLFSGVVMWSLEATVSNEGVDIVGSHGRTPAGFVRNIPRTMYLSFSTLFGTNSHSPKTSYGRFYSFFWVVFSMLILSSYTANLASILSTESPESDIQTIEDIMRMDGTLCNKLNTAFGAYINHTYAPKGLKIKWGNDLDSLAKMVVSGECTALVEVQLLAEYLVTNNLPTDDGGEGGEEAGCQFMQVGELFWRQNMAVGCNFELADSVNSFSEYISELKSSGELDLLREKWFTSSACQLDVNDSDEALPMNEKHFLAPMILFACIAFVALFIEYGRRWIKSLFDRTHDRLFGKGDKAIAKLIEAEVNPTLAADSRMREKSTAPESPRSAPAMSVELTAHGSAAQVSTQVYAAGGYHI